MSTPNNSFLRINLGHILSIGTTLIMCGVIYGTLITRVSSLESQVKEQWKAISEQRDKFQDGVIGSLQKDNTVSSRLASIEAKVDYLIRKLDGKNAALLQPYGPGLARTSVSEHYNPQ